MSKRLIPINEVLFVFEAWTLMVRSDFVGQLEPDMIVCLFDSRKNKIGKVKLNKFLSSRNPEIKPIEVAVIDAPENMKDAKYIEI